MSTLTQDTKRRVLAEKLIEYALAAATGITILTTFGILFSILFEAIQFFKLQSFFYFLTGTEWSPGVEGAKFGAVPIFTGTLVITFIAILLAVPVGLFTAIYLSEYASKKTRDIAKPIIETLAGIPTVVYGFFAAITVAPFVVNAFASIGVEASFNNALASGLVMGIMIVPIIASMSDDVISSVPDHMRKGSMALGMTRSETIKFIVVPAALPGIISAVLLGLSRAIGETMIVVMAAGMRANLSFNPLEDMTTVTVRIVDALTGDSAFDSPDTLSAFALGLALFVFTLILNIISVYTIRKFKEKYKSSNL